MAAHFEIRWLRVLPRRISLLDAAGRRHEADWLDPGDPRRSHLPEHTRRLLDDSEARFGSAAWGRYSWRTLMPVLGAVVFAAAVIIGAGSFAMFPRRMIVALLVVVIGILPLIVLGCAIGGRLWSRRTGAAARINACISGGRCPACLGEIDSLTDRPIETVTCPCGGVWPTLGAIQSGGQSISQVATVARASELAWLIPFGFISVVLSFAIPRIPFENQVVGGAAAVISLLLFAPFITRGLPERALRLGLAVAAPPIVFLLWYLAHGFGINMPLLIGGVAAFGVCYGTGRIGAREPRPGWEVARFVCESCGYDLRGAATTGASLRKCPECGGEVRSKQPPAK